MSLSVQNLEDAAAVASEFISSLDNLPNEVHHLLQEIRHKDMRSQEIQQELAKDQARFIRHSLRHPSPSVTTPGALSNASSAAPSPPGQTPTIGSSKLLIPSKVEIAYDELNQLADEKIALAQKIMDVLARTRARLDFDLAKVRVLQGEVGDVPSVKQYHSYSGASTPLAPSESISFAGRNPPSAIVDNVRNLLAPDVLPLSPAATAAAMASVTKKRRVAATNSIKLPSPVPQPNVSTSSMPSRSRLSRQIQLPRPAEEDAPELDIDPDAEGDEDIEGDDAEDSTLYCFCQKPGSGEMMIGCDNPSCPYQWFHISCVGVKQPLPDKWYCQECKSKGAGAPGRKGRRKAS